MLRYLCLLGVVLGVNSGSAPFINPCKSGDNACLFASSQAAIPYLAVGVPELGVKSLDPLYLDEVHGEQGGLSITFKDSTVKGLKGCTVEAVKHTLSKSKQVIIIRCSVELVGDYILDGQLLVFPIKGQGKYNIKIRDIVIKASSHVSVVDGADGRKHWHIDDWHYTSETKTGAVFKFDNLFNGNRILADPVVNFINNNWEDVMNEVAPPIVRAIVTRVVEAVEALYKAVPADELEIK